MNAIILAAGFGSRFKELTKNRHKALFEIDKIPNIERNIKFLNEIGIYEIHIVTGYLHEQFDYLKEKFGVNLIHNDRYKTHNNLSSFCVALDYFQDSFVIDSDVVMLKNIFRAEKHSAYYTVLRRKSEKNEWVVKLSGNRVVGIEVTNKHLPSLLGISYFTKSDAEVIKSKIKTLKEDAFTNSSLYWDNIAIEMLDVLDIKARQVDENLAYEMDDLQDLEEINGKICMLKQQRSI